MNIDHNIVNRKNGFNIKDLFKFDPQKIPENLYSIIQTYNESIFEADHFYKRKNYEKAELQYLNSAYTGLYLGDLFLFNNTIEMAFEFYLSSLNCFFLGDNSTGARLILKKLNPIILKNEEYRKKVKEVLSTFDISKMKKSLDQYERDLVDFILTKILEVNGYLSGKYQIMKIIFKINERLAYKNVLGISSSARSSFAPIVYDSISEYIDKRIKLNLLRRDAENHLIINNLSYFNVLKQKNNIVVKNLLANNADIIDIIQNTIDDYVNLTSKDWKKLEKDEYNLTINDFGTILG